MSNEDNNTLDIPVKAKNIFIEVASNIHPSPMRFNVNSGYIYGSKNKSGSIYTLEDGVSIHGLLSASKATSRVITRIL
jgi:hypothetical protein